MLIFIFVTVHVWSGFQSYTYNEIGFFRIFKDTVKFRSSFGSQMVSFTFEFRLHNSDMQYRLHLRIDRNYINWTNYIHLNKQLAFEYSFCFRFLQRRTVVQSNIACSAQCITHCTFYRYIRFKNILTLDTSKPSLIIISCYCYIIIKMHLKPQGYIKSRKS